jgi:phosphoribosylanthranilate isomerase
LYQIKICGITRIPDAQVVALAGADAAGINFYPESKRYVAFELAEKIAKVLSGRVHCSGVFVNASADEIRQAAEALKLDAIQLHGDEPPEFLTEFPDQQIVKAFRFGERGIEEVGAYLEQCRVAGKVPDAVLVDACRPGEYGGTGEQPDWSVVAGLRETLGEVPMVLAGGLTAFNVAEAIAATRCNAVDVASGVESKPGQKDPMLVRAFVNSARKALSALS